LNEGFATWYAYYISHLAFPDLGFYDDARRGLSNSLVFDADPWAVPMSHYVETPYDIDQRFNYVSYGKAGTVLRMFQEAFSERTFTKGVSYYLKKMKYSAAEPEDLFSAMQQAYNEDNPTGNVDMKEIWSTWVYQAGYPIISVDTNTTHLLLSQHRYYSGNELYSIPISYATQSNPNFDKKTVELWLHTNEAHIPLSSLNMRQSDWIVLNNQQTGYYRVSYSDQLWLVLAENLKQNYKIFHPINREVLINELETGYLMTQSIAPTTVLEFLEYVKYDEDLNYLNILNVLTLLDSLYASFFGTTVFDQYLIYIQNLAYLPLTRLGLENRDGEDFAIWILRNIWKGAYCSALGTTCLQQEKQKLHDFMIDELNEAPDDFCAAFRYANESIFHHYLNELATNPELFYRFSITVSLGCTLDKGLLEDLIAVVEDSTNILEQYDREDIILSMLSSSVVGFEVAYAYVKRNVDKIESFLMVISQLINTNEYYDDFKLVLADAVSQGFLEQYQIEGVLYSIDEHFEWQDTHWTEINQYFGSFNETTPPIITTTLSTSPSTPANSTVIVTTTPGTTAPTTIASTTSDGSATTTFASIFLLIASIVLNFVIYES
jgi:aminopeptidase N